jgi:hypothetical protein
MCIYIVDDGSSTISCTEFIPEDRQDVPVMNKFNISELVRVCGMLNEFKKRREIKIRHMSEHLI